jgi:hypothetical protein
MEPTADISQAFSMMFKTINNNHVQGENGAFAFQTPASTNDDFDGTLVELFLLVRRESQENIFNILSKLKTIIETNSNTKAENLKKLIKISLYIRNPRHGKGERDIFYNILEWMWENYQEIAKFMINVIKDFGYWGDFSHLYEISSSTIMKEYLVELYSNQLNGDYKMLFRQGANISLAGKWAPREHSKYSKFARALTKSMFKNITSFKQGKKVYRLTIGALNSRLKTVETLMCDKNWETIDFAKVPSVAMTNLSKAFQDEYVNPYPINKRKNNTHRQSQRRHKIGQLDFEDREACRQNLKSHIENDNKINSSVSNITDIIKRYMNGESEDIVWEVQWKNRINEIKTLIKETENTTNTIFPMIDLSSSMSGEPMLNAIALGTFCATAINSSVNDNVFANKFLTFNTTPELATLPKEENLYTTIKSVKEWSSCWGGSTNIQSALELILDIAVNNNVTQDEMPKVLAIFTDMQFNQGDGKWNETSYEMLKRKFEEKSYVAPHVIFWNLRSNTTGYQVKASTPNVTMLSGYSTRMMDLFLSGSVDTLASEFDNDVEIKLNNKQKPTTLEIMQKVFEHDMFDCYLHEMHHLVYKNQPKTDNNDFASMFTSMFSTMFQKGTQEKKNNLDKDIDEDEDLDGDLDDELDDDNQESEKNDIENNVESEKMESQESQQTQKTQKVDEPSITENTSTRMQQNQCHIS